MISAYDINLLRRQSAAIKLQQVNNALGNTGVANQQGTTRIIYDTPPSVGLNEIIFFREASSRQFPFTNLQSNGNKLDIGESMVIDKIAFFCVGTYQSTVQTIAMWSENLSTAIPLMDGEFSVFIGNSQVVKPIPMTSLYYTWLAGSKDVHYGLFSFETFIVIPPLMNFEVKLRLNMPIVDNTTRVRCQLHGLGSLLDVKQNL